ncbi:MAG: P-loop NTPase [Sphingobacteriia bacterium]|nr:P-loop NTPase [Sphingobacteriia bacterium]
MNNKISEIMEKLSYEKLGESLNIQTMVERENEIAIIIDVDKDLYNRIVKSRLEEDVTKKIAKSGINAKIKFIYNQVLVEPKIVPLKPSQKENLKQIVPIKGVKKVIVVVSGKGGVGKSTMSVNLAASFVKLGLSTALVDADIYGPSVPSILGINRYPELKNNLMLPIEVHGIKSISIGYIVDPEKAAIWRGPMITKALSQLIRGTKWQDIDVMIIDMPPGTGDIHLSLMENYPIDGIIGVSFPSKLSVADLKKSIAMCEKMKQPLIGIINNCAYERNGNEIIESPFGANHLNDFCKDKNIEILGEIEISRELAQSIDVGKPYILEEKCNPYIAKEFKSIAEKVIQFLEKRPRLKQQK